jgi:multiple sugar transport system ATP-binding protein
LAAIEFDGVTKIYGEGVRAVSDLNLTVQDGEFVVLLGPSGCGKSTALRMVAGLEAITGGEIRIGGRRVNSVEPRDRDVAMVFQNYALYPHMDVEDNIGFGLRVRGVPKPERRSRIRRAAGVLGLIEYLQRKPGQLSGGQRQRVAMGRAIVRQPKAFLMDEPLSNLDARLRVQMRTEIVRIQRELNVTTIYVTHDQIEAMTMADRVAVMRGGILQQVDTPDGVYSHPANLFVASFIGSPAMNLIEGTLEHENAHTRCRLGSQAIEIPDTVLTTHRRLRDQVGSTVAVGIRPEGLSLGSSTTQPTLTGNVVISESLGFETLVYLDVDAKPVSRAEVLESLPDAASGDPVSTQLRDPSTTTLVARLPAGTPVTEGQPLTLAVDPGRLDFFDLGNGRAID